MRYFALATDYDGTLAKDGIADEAALEALRRFRQSGRKLILVTGRELPDLEKTFPFFDLFDRIVAENGAVILNPANRDKRILAQRPPESFLVELQRRGVTNISVGDVIVATWRPHETAVLESIQRQGLELQIIFNKDAVMVLPTGVNKMTGLNDALSELQLSRHNVAAIGDAENDHSFLSCCECSAAVANAIPSLKKQVDLVTEGDHGSGVAELVEQILQDDLRSLPFRPERRGVLLGRDGDRDIYIDAEGKTVLLCGQSGGGKSTFVAGFTERLMERNYQVGLVDPEGDYENMPGFVQIGDPGSPPGVEQIFEILKSPDAQLIINLVGVQMKDRPAFFSSLLAQLQEMRLREGRPHWMVIDEAHHLLPQEWAPASAEVAGRTASLLLVTVHPEHVSEALLRQVNVLAVVGNEPRKYVEEFARAAGIPAPAIGAAELKDGELAVWLRDSDEGIERMQSIPGKAERKRHRRKYAEGELEEDRVFYFRGPEEKLNLRARNLSAFLELAAGVDDETWLHHLRRGDYSLWLARDIKDRDLAEEVRRVEENGDLSPEESRAEVSKAIEAKYTGPA